MAPGSLQEKQSWLHSLRQQTPSAQTPVAHSALVVQVSPAATFSLHMPVASQKKPAWQGLASEQVRLQAPFWQLVGQAWVVPARQVPLPSHTRDEDSVVP